MMFKGNVVVITGMSAITPHGIGLDSFWHNCKQVKSSVSKIDLFKIPSTFSQVAGIAYDFFPETLFCIIIHLREKSVNIPKL